jgi:DNA-binding NtrC family response regulator
MILLITSSSRAQECISAIQELANEETRRAESRHAACELLRENEFSVVVIDQCLLEPDPDLADQALFQQMGSALPIYVNLAISGSERVAREVQAALKRRQRETTIAQRAAETALRNELKDSLTAVLLSCQMALGVQGVPPSAVARIKSIHEAAAEMRGHLGLPDTEAAL